MRIFPPFDSAILTKISVACNKFMHFLDKNVAFCNKRVMITQNFAKEIINAANFRINVRLFSAFSRTVALGLCGRFAIKRVDVSQTSSG
jgi:hypothetical protein